jgi:F-type H+-transporting ATPase subunit b
MIIWSWRLVAAGLIVAWPLLALGAEGHGDDHHGMSTPLKLTVMTINLAIFLFLLRATAWPMMKEWVAARRRSVVEALEKAAIVTREAEALKQQWSDRLASLDREIDEMRAQARTQIEAEREQILEATRKVSEGIRRDAERAAEQELRNAQERLRAEVAAQAYQLACKAAPPLLGTGEQRRFVDEFIEQVST